MIKRLPDGTKALQKDEGEDRCLEYRNMHREMMGRRCYVQDLDQIEFRETGDPNDPYRIVAIIDITRSEEDVRDQTSYLQSVYHRYFHTSAQGAILRKAQAAFKVPAYLVLFKQSLTDFWIYSLGHSRWAGPYTQQAYVRWIKAL